MFYVVDETNESNTHTDTWKKQRESKNEKTWWAKQRSEKIVIPAVYPRQTNVAVNCSFDWRN